MANLWSKFCVGLTRQILRFAPVGMPLVYVGPGASQTMARAIVGFQHQRCLLVTDKVLRDLGLLGPLQKTLNDGGVDVAIFDGILPDPDTVQVEAGIKAAREFNADCVLALGGGSVLDAAKMIAALCDSEQTLQQAAGIMKLKAQGLPLYCVPTTSGTGSEASFAAAISDTAAVRKIPVADPKLLPQAAALDPDLLIGMPKGITAATGMDALTHALEAWLSTLASPESDRFALQACVLIFKNLRKAYDNGSDKQAREEMAVASFYASAAFSRASLGYVHAIAHQLGALYHVPHGLANAVILPKVLAFYRGENDGRMAEIARACGLAGEALTDAQAAQALVEAVEQLLIDLQIGSELEAIQQKDIPEIRQRAFDEAHGLYGYPVPKYMNKADCESLLGSLLVAA